ncbi:MAG TPA: DUF3352 domain-containing protein [Planctomycetaceae bacterium]|nr:DUF3352 domain-containing protein [Planctomycetaceae bacterium]
MRKLMLVLATMTALCPVGRVWSQDEDVYGEALLPPETLLMISAPDIPALSERMSASTSGKMLADPKLKPFIDQVKAKVEEFSGQVKEHLGVSLTDLAELPQGEITFALVEKPARKLNGVLLIDYADNDEVADKLIEKMDAALTDNGAEHSTQMVGDLEVEVYKLAGGKDNPLKTLCYFTDEGYFVLATDLAAIKSVIERWKGDAKTSLADQEIFAYIMEKCDTGEESAVFKWYVNPIGLVQAAISMVPQASMAMGFIPVLGLDRMKGFGGTMDVGVENYDYVSKSFAYVEQPVSGVLGLFNFPAVDQVPPAWVPADAAMYMGLNWNVEEAYLSVESVVDSFQGPGSLGKLLDAFAADESGPGIHVKNDVLDNLAGKMQIVTMAPADGDDAPPVPPMTFSIAVKDAAAMQKTLGKAAKSDGFPGKARQFEGVTVYDIPADQLTVAVAVVGDALVISTNPATVESRVRGKSASSLANSAAYKAFVKYLPKKSSMLTFQKQDAQVKAAYDMLKKQDNDQLEGIDLSTLPDFSVIQKYLKPTVSYAIPDENGAFFMGFSLSDE